jgi:hypothetical protein
MGDISDVSTPSLQGREAFDKCHRIFAAALETVEGKENRIPTENFLSVCDGIGGLFEAMFMGMVASQLKADIDNSANNVRLKFLKHPDKCHTLEDLVIHDLKHRGRHEVRNDRASGTVALIWAKRSVQFVVMYLELLGANPEITASECAQTTYEKVLAPYHGWLTSKFVATVMGLAPDREDIYTKLGLHVEPLLAINEFVATANPVMAEIQRLLDEHDCDFPDKV